MNQVQESIINKLVDIGVRVTVCKDGFELEGFYKSGGCTWLESKDYGFLAHTRYGEETEIECFDDLVFLNHSWWQRSKDRFEGWKQPELAWANEMERLGLVRKQTITYFE